MVITDNELLKVKEELRNVKQINRNMRNILADLEWTTESVPPNACPWCLQYNPGHSFDCKLNKLLNV